MKKLLGFLFLTAALAVSCEDGEGEAPVCEVRATVRDLTGLDGCGFVFELEHGTRLEPIRTFYCGTPPPSADIIAADPLYNIEFFEGKKVKISYTAMTDMSTTCMAGQPVRITCLTEERMLHTQE